MRRLLVALVALAVAGASAPAHADDESALPAPPTPPPTEGDEAEVVLVNLVDLGLPHDAAVLAGLIDIAHDGIEATAALDGVDLMAATVTPAGRTALERSALVEAVRAPRRLEFLLDTSAVAIEATTLHPDGNTGDGRVVAVVDSGVDADHPGFDGSVVAEACFLTGADTVPGTTPRELCGNSPSALTATGAGAAVPCTLLPAECTHGTHLAGIISGDDPSFPGVAPDAGILAIRVGAVLDDGFGDVNHIPELGVLAALEHVYELRDTYDIAAVNLSLGGDPGSCTDVNWEDVIGRLTDAGIAVVAASGNGGSSSSIMFPACLDDVISVGASAIAGDAFDEEVPVDPCEPGPQPPAVSCFTDTSPDLDLLAPGQEITSTVLSSYDASGFATLKGTSFAAPHVAAAFALVGDKDHFGPDRVRQLMRATGEMVTRPSTGERFPELRLSEVASFTPFPDATNGYWVTGADWAKHTGVSTGIGGLFEPDLSLTRAQAVTFLWRFMGSPAATTANGFSDVPDGAWYTEAVDWAAETGVTTGFSPTVFKPDDLVTRDQVATFLWRTVGEPAASVPTGFGDVPPGAYFEVAVAWMADNGITTGTSATTFSPGDVVTRAQMVTFEHRVANASGAWTGAVDPPDLALF